MRAGSRLPGDAALDGPALDDVVGLLRGRTRTLLGVLDDAGVTDAHAWPRPVGARATTFRLVRQWERLHRRYWQPCQLFGRR